MRCPPNDTQHIFHHRCWTNDSLRYKMANTAGLFILFLFVFLKPSNAETLNRRIGINYGKLGNNLLLPFQSIELIKSMKAGYVKIYDTDPETLRVLSGTKLRVSIMVPNDQIPEIGKNENIASQWVQANVLAYLPDTQIRYIMVGNEILSTKDQALWENLVPAMTLIKKILRSYEIHNIKVSTPLAMDFLDQSFPPSNASFRVDTLSVMIPLLQFLKGSNANLFLDVYPYLSWSENPTDISLSSALLEADDRYYKDPGSGLIYTNLLDQMLDSVHFAMSKLGFPDVGITISETGWPNVGDLNGHGANIQNAATYTHNLIRKIMADPPIGTPARPGAILQTFLFALYDENLKPGPEVERHWGLLRPDGTPVYEIDLSGSGNYNSVSTQRRIKDHGKLSLIKGATGQGIT